MLIIDFNDTTRQTFAKGFWKGLGAPFMLFGTFTVAAHLPKIDLVELPARFTSGGDDASDWGAVGRDMRVAFAKYEQETTR